MGNERILLAKSTLSDRISGATAASVATIDEIVASSMRVKDDASALAPEQIVVIGVGIYMLLFDLAKATMAK